MNVAEEVPEQDPNGGPGGTQPSVAQDKQEELFPTPDEGIIHVPDSSDLDQFLLTAREVWKAVHTMKAKSE